MRTPATTRDRRQDPQWGHLWVACFNFEPANPQKSSISRPSPNPVQFARFSPKPSRIDDTEAEPSEDVIPKWTMVFQSACYPHSSV